MRRDGLVALTLGAEGAVLLEDGEEVARATPPAVEAVDGTAAGDAFTACLLVSLLEGRDREEALRRACAAGALAASRPVPSRPCRRQPRSTRYWGHDRRADPRHPRLRPGARRRDRPAARAREPRAGGARRHHGLREPDAREDDGERAAGARPRRPARRPRRRRGRPSARARAHGRRARPRRERARRAHAAAAAGGARRPARGRLHGRAHRRRALIRSRSCRPARSRTSRSCSTASAARTSSGSC